MNKVDYVIVGYGIAALTFAQQCLENNKSFVIFDDGTKGASKVAAGAINPLVLKRFNAVWEAKANLLCAEKFYKGLEKKLGDHFYHAIPTWRIIASEDEKRTWQNKRRMDEKITEFLSPKFIENQYNALNAPFGFGLVHRTAYVDLSLLLERFKQHYINHFINEVFKVNEVDFSDKNYHELSFNHIIFAEGIHLLENPMLQWVPLVANQGQTLIIETAEKLPKALIKSKSFLMPWGDQQYYVGSTYNRKVNNLEQSDIDKVKLKTSLNFFFKGNYKIIEQRVGIRPTVPDRRPLIGRHKDISSFYIYNGLGSRGALYAPAMGKYLFNFIEFNKELPDEIDIKRYYPKK